MATGRDARHKKMKPLSLLITFAVLHFSCEGRAGEIEVSSVQTPDDVAGHFMDDPPNVVVILADDLGYGDLGSYGCKDIRTPNLDRLAETGVRLTDGYVTHPYCGPSRAGLMTGRYQQRFGYQFNPSHQVANQGLGVDVGEETLADVFRRAGYKTGAFGKWHLGAAEQFHPNNRGFDEFYGFLDGGHHYFPARYPELLKRCAEMQPPPTPELFAYSQPLQINGMSLPPVEGYLTDLLTDRAIGFIQRAKGLRFSSIWPTMPRMFRWRHRRTASPNTGPSLTKHGGPTPPWWIAWMRTSAACSRPWSNPDRERTRWWFS